MFCHSDYDCKRLQECNLNTFKCQHVDIFSPDFPVQIAALCVYPIFTGFATAGNFGTAAIQIFMLLLWLNFTIKESSSISQPIIAGLSFAAWMKRFHDKHPLRKSSIIDYQLATILLCPLMAGYLAGLQLRFFLPPLIISIFLTLQISLLILKALVQYRQLKALQQLQNNVKNEIQKNNESPKEQEQVSETFQTLQELGDFDLDEIHIDFHKIFKFLSKSKYKELYLKHLPSELADLEFNKLTKDQEIKAKDYFLQKYKKTEIIDFQKKHVRQIQKQKTIKAIDVYIYPAPIIEIILMILILALNALNMLIMGGTYVESIIDIKMCSNSYWISFGSQYVGNIILFIIIFFIMKFRHDIEFQKAKEMVQKEYDKLESFKREEEEIIKQNELQLPNDDINANQIVVEQLREEEQIEQQIYNIFPTEVFQNQADKIPVEENAQIVSIHQGPHIKCSQLVKATSEEYTSVQALDQIIEDFSIKEQQAAKQQKQQLELANMEVQFSNDKKDIFSKNEEDQLIQRNSKNQIEQKQNNVQVNQTQTKTIQQKKIQRNARVDIPMNTKSLIIVSIVGIVNGFFVGFIGVGFSLIMAIMLVKLRLSLQSVLATLPVIIFFVCVLGSLVQIQQGVVKWELSLFFFGLSFGGNLFFTSFFTKIFKKFKILTCIVSISILFYFVLLAVYLYIFITKAISNTEAYLSLTNKFKC